VLLKTGKAFNKSNQRFVIASSRSGESIVDDAFVGVLGDFEGEPESEGWLGNTSTVEYSECQGIRAVSSLSGFPPLFLVELNGWVGVISDIELLKKIPGYSLRLDPLSILELCKIGFPVGHKTLFKGVVLIPAGKELRITPLGQVRIAREWEPEARLMAPTVKEHSTQPVRNFDRAIKSLNLEGSMFSLSGGLDTRAIFAGLMRHGIFIPAFTVSGPRLTLDAVIAQYLCRQYGLEHQVVVLGNDFRNRFWELSKEASLRSGGVSSLWSAPQVFCYQTLGIGKLSTKVLSGFLGNQIGRGAAERTSARGVNIDILNAEVIEGADMSVFRQRWFGQGLRQDGIFERRFLVQNENLFASLASYAIGHRDAEQQSPYASAVVVSSAIAEPFRSCRRSSWSPTMRELGRRVFGVSNFQQDYIRQIGGLCAKYPINWGWRASGGVSLIGLQRGFRAFAEEVLAALSERHVIAAEVLKRSRLKGFSSHLQMEEWVKPLREPVLDLLRSAKTREGGVLNVRRSEAIVQSLFERRDARSETLVALADILLLQENYSASLG
jgi:hypothetical protein